MFHWRCGVGLKGLGRVMVVWPAEGLPPFCSKRAARLGPAAPGDMTTREIGTQVHNNVQWW